MSFKLMMHYDLFRVFFFVVVVDDDIVVVVGQHDDDRRRLTVAILVLHVMRARPYLQQCILPLDTKLELLWEWKKSTTC